MGNDRETSRKLEGGPDVNKGARSAARTARGSRLAFASALSVLMLGTFISFGGLSYAATQTKDAVHTLTKVAGAQKVVVHHSSAAAQYPHNKPTAPGKQQLFTPPPAPGSTATTQSDGTLPFTGLSLGGTALVSGLLLLVGIALRRRERRSS